MQKINVMINGIPGNMAATVAQKALRDGRFEVIPTSLTGPEIEQTDCIIGERSFTLIQPADRIARVKEIRAQSGPFISVDYTHPSAVNDNAAFYCDHALPFVMGTTGGDRLELENRVRKSAVPAVISPNMAKQIVGFQAMMAYAAVSFPDLFKGYTLQVRESHQQGKADTSGTAKAMIGYFNSLGIPFTEADIVKERTPENQMKEWSIPKAYLSGHGWHTYSLDSSDRTVHFEFTHNVNGREVYAEGTLDAVAYLAKKIQSGVRGTVFTMMDVLRNV